MQVVLVAKVLDPLDLAHGRAVARLGDAQVLRTRSDRLRSRWRRAGRDEPRWNQIDRRLAEARRHIDVSRVGIDFARRADLDQHALLDDADPVRHRHGFGLVVGDVEDRRAELLLDALQLEAQIGAQLGVERRERLVHQVDRGPAHKRAADGDALHLAAGQLRGAVLELAGDAQHGRDLVDAPLDLVLRHAARRRAQREGEVVVGGEVRVERILLEDERRRLARRARRW